MNVDVVHDQRRVPLALVDDPEVPMRDQFDDEAFAELRDSIRENGLQVMPIVEQRGDRYRIVAGHRRIEACRQLGVDELTVDVRQPSDMDAEAIKIIENDEREKVNAADAAIYLERLFLERCHNDVDELCALTRRNRKYVDERLKLRYGDEQVFAAVKARKIGLGVARELNRIADVGYRHMYLDLALKEGMTEDTAKDKRRKFEQMVQRSTLTKDLGRENVVVVPGPINTDHVCHVCRLSNHPERMRWITVHDHCDLAHLEPLLGPIREHYAAMTADQPTPRS